MLGFLGPIANLANTFVEGRVEKTKAVAKAKVARAEAEAEVMKVAATHEAGWESQPPPRLPPEVAQRLSWSLGVS